MYDSFKSLLFVLPAVCMYECCVVSLSLSVCVRAIWYVLSISLTRSSSPPLFFLPFVALPKVVAFDLDATLWYPEMYQLWGGGSPFRKNPDGTLTDKAGTK